MTDDEEVFWAKLNGNWDTAGYRFQLAAAGKCLQTLKNDRYRMIADMAMYNINGQEENDIQQPRKKD